MISLKNINRQKWLGILLWSQLILMMLIVLGFVDEQDNDMFCKAINISIDNEAGGHYFVESTDIREDLMNKGNMGVGKPLGNISIPDLEKLIRENPFIARAEVYRSIDGEIDIEVEQRVPLLRVINTANENFYIDEHGVLMPLSDKYTARVPVASGCIYEKYAYDKPVELHATGRPGTEENSRVNTTLDTLYTLALYIKSNVFASALVQQIYVNELHELELIPSFGKHRIILGDLSGIDSKFEKLRTFYREALSKTGWDRYSIISLKFQNQVVCTKNENYADTASATAIPGKNLKKKKEKKQGAAVTDTTSGRNTPLPGKEKIRKKKKESAAADSTLKIPSGQAQEKKKNRKKKSAQEPAPDSSVSSSPEKPAGTPVKSGKSKKRKNTD